MKWLVEEHEMEPYSGPETITFHVIVEAHTHRTAYIKAMLQSIAVRDQGFYHDAQELTEWVPDYFWYANDGSFVWYEVRKLEA